ncbi:hypothetical protein V490_06061 [Pseudogymnoascus sp. VKM F-3557]|nr:hypothetical protein V490_06061 [Pseudogymnoascus sp. VKM F-3557]
MTPKATPRCSCGGKMKTGGALSDHLRDSPKHNKPLIKGKVAPMPVNLQTKPGTSVMVNNMTIFHVTNSSPPVAEAAKDPLAHCTAKVKSKDPGPIFTAAKETSVEKVEKLDANLKETQMLHDKLIEARQVLEFEITTELKASIKKKLKKVLKKEVEAEIKAEFGDDLKKLKDKMMAEFMLGLKSDFKEVIKEEIKNEFRMTVAYQLSSQATNDPKTEPMDDMKSTLKAELKTELVAELKDSHKSGMNKQSAKESNEDWRLCCDDTCGSCGYCMDNIVMV